MGGAQRVRTALAHACNAGRGSWEVFPARCTTKFEKDLLEDVSSVNTCDRSVCQPFQVVQWLQDGVKPTS